MLNNQLQHLLYVLDLRGGLPGAQLVLSPTEESHHPVWTRAKLSYDITSAEAAVTHQICFPVCMGG